jgi:hypothetical protein
MNAMSKLYLEPRKKIFFYIGLCCFGLLIVEIFFLPPQGILPFALFFLLIFSGLFYLLSFIFNNSRTGLLISIALTIYTGLRFLGLHHWLYPLLIGVIIMIIEIYFQKRN